MIHDFCTLEERRSNDSRAHQPCRSWSRPEFLQPDAAHYPDGQRLAPALTTSTFRRAGSRQQRHHSSHLPKETLHKEQSSILRITFMNADESTRGPCLHRDIGHENIACITIEEPVKPAIVQVSWVLVETKYKLSIQRCLPHSRMRASDTIRHCPGFCTFRAAPFRPRSAADGNAPSHAPCRTPTCFSSECNRRAFSTSQGFPIVRTMYWDHQHVFISGS